MTKGDEEESYFAGKVCFISNSFIWKELIFPSSPSLLQSLVLRKKRRFSLRLMLVSIAQTVAVVEVAAAVVTEATGELVLPADVVDLGEAVSTEIRQLSTWTTKRLSHPCHKPNIEEKDDD